MTGNASARDVATLVAEAVAVPASVSSRVIDRHARAHDASHFLLVPEAVAVAEDADDVARLMKVAVREHIPVTFRSGGTSLSGQAVGSGLLVDTRRRFQRAEVLDLGARVRVQPGLTVRAVNARLARYGRALGPDPASEAACTIGGVIANNSSGMTCGVETNAYRTLRSAVLVLTTGTVLDTGRPDADGFLANTEPAITEGLLALRDRIRGDPASVATIRRLFAMKNTMGYALNAFLDYDSPAELLTHLVVGSEGTLAFVAEAEFATVSAATHAATGLLVFADVDAAAEALPALITTEARAIELLDDRALRVAREDPSAPASIRSLTIDRHAALLVEYAAEDDARLRALVEAGERCAETLALETPVRFTTDAPERASLWRVRKGLYAAIAEARPAGTLALLEDIAVPPDRLAAMCRRLHELFVRFGYPEAVIFGHARDGNLHFMITDRFDEADRLAALEAFTEALVEAVLAEGGTLKAEHGTGRAMAPFVERQYGAELYDVMRELKRLLDPAGVLNPGVVLSADPRAHLENLKRTTAIEEEVDRCVECGYCEPVCPSRDLTLTPRQRIVVRRAARLAELDGDEATARALTADYDYEGLQTCAVDGMCQVACPVRINTGDLVKRLRAEEASPVLATAWSAAARLWKPVTAVASAALDIVPHLPSGPVRGANSLARTLLGDDTVPEWSPELPRGGRRRRRRTHEHPTDVDAVYFPACVSAMFGAAEGEGVQSALLALAERAGVTLQIPSGIDGLCCGTPWSSKGYLTGRDHMRERLAAALAPLTDGGRLPVVVDASSCTEGVRHALDDDPRFRVVDAVAFARETLLPQLPSPRRVRLAAVHPTCSTTRLGTTPDLLALAAALAEEVRVPDSWACCGFAGDRGMLHPELTASATRTQAEEVRAMGADVHLSSNRTCELGMTRATGSAYRHVLEVLEDATRPPR